MRPRIPVLALAAITLLLWAGPGAAQDKSQSANRGGAFENIGGSFTLTDQFGKTRGDTEFRGRFMLVYFGYANCQSTCPISLRHAMEALDQLSPKDQARIQPILITVDPENDTPAALARILPKYSPRLLGLTGSDARLGEAYRNYRIVETKQVSVAPDGTPIFAHGTFIYLMRPDGGFATLIPPILTEDQMARILRRYVSKES